MAWLARKFLKEDGTDPLDSSFDVLCFGHLIFEMALGYELKSLRPDVEQLVGKCEYDVIELMVFIFFHPDDRIPSLEEVRNFSLLKRAECRELIGFLDTPMVCLSCRTSSTSSNTNQEFVCNSLMYL